jgi:EAL domain-containing protein (putative c-di-GMP-specific phosphodiesterase class I)
MTTMTTWPWLPRPGGAPTVAVRSHDSAELNRAIDGVRPLFQPVVRLDDLSVVGYESLARGPRGSRLAKPLALVAAARKAGRIAELDATMARRSIQALAQVDWDPSLTLFGNSDPEAMTSAPDPATMKMLGRAAAAGTRIVIEITEKSLLANPQALIVAIALLRSRGWGIAMDDVGVEDDSLTLLPILRPDVVKLDMSILHRPFDAHAAWVSAATRTYCDRTGALMVCEGVETEAHEVRARALGADLVQGFRYGVPAPLPAVTGPARPPVALLGLGVAENQPLADRLRLVPEAVLPATQIADLAIELVATAAGYGSDTVVMTTAPGIDKVPTDYLDAMAAAVPSSALVALIAPGCGPHPAPGVRGVNASMQNALGSPWSVSIIGPTMAVSILAEERGADLRDPVRHRIVHDRMTVAQILRVVLGQSVDPPPTAEVVAS